ncbi:MAG: C4-type zinc ribbon domain-containing protein [Nitrospiraceae bacterium]|nr:C4-type zinc ribbon domain-containing protein [Nitrospiraceae bacterium]
MNNQLKLLIELQELDKEIIDKSALVARIPERIHEEEKALLEVKARLDAAKKQQESFLKQKRDMDSEVEQMNQRISKLKSRTSEIKTNKEYQAHLKEIESAEKEVFKYEDGILSIMENMEAADKAVKAGAVVAKAEEEKLAAISKELEAERSRAEKELSLLKSRRADFAGLIEGDIYELYMGLLQKHQRVAVVEARNEICGGCNMKIMPQLYVQIKETDDIYQCPQCDRILYRAVEQIEEPSPPK